MICDFFGEFSSDCQWSMKLSGTCIIIWVPHEILLRGQIRNSTSMQREIRSFENKAIKLEKGEKKSLLMNKTIESYSFYSYSIACCIDDNRWTVKRFYFYRFSYELKIRKCASGLFVLETWSCFKTSWLLFDIKRVIKKRWV